MHQKLAVIDIGSNTVKYSLFDEKVDEKEGKRIPVKVGGDSVTVRFLHYVKDGEILPEGMDRLLETLSDFSAQLARKDIAPEDILCVATAGFRSLARPEEAISQVLARTGIRIRLLSGYEEARITFAGMHCHSSVGKGALLDMGGGSTELIFFDEGKLRFSVSMPFGALSLQEKFCKGEFPDAQEAETISSFVREHLGLCGGKNALESLFGKHHYLNVYIVGGTAKAIGARNAELLGRSYQAGSYGMMPRDFREQLNRYLSGDAEALARLRECYPERYRVIVPGMLAFEELFVGLGAGVILVSGGGIREGVAFEYWNRER